MGLHRAGNLAEAALAYQAVLAAAPKDAAALHAFGVLRHQMGESAAACALFERAMARGLTTAECWFNLGLARFRLGEFAAAEAAFRRAAAARPGWKQPHYDLGNALVAQGKIDAACKAFRAALKIDADYVPAAVNLANALQRAGRLAEAAAEFRRVLARHPSVAEAQNNLGTVLQAQGDAAGAEAAFRAALRLQPAFPDALLNLGGLLRGLGKRREALACLQQAAALAPEDARVVEALCGALRDGEDFAAARAAAERLCALRPGERAARFTLAECCRRLQDYAAAAGILRALVAEAPESAEAHNDLANVLRAQGDFDAAEQHYQAAVAALPSAVHLTNYWALLRDRMRLEAARAVLAQAEAVPGARDDAAMAAAIDNGTALTDLTDGRLEAGFRRFEARRVDFGIADLPGREWLGEDPAGLRLLVSAEQGLGDTIHFLRYVPLLAARGAQVVLRVPAPLQSLAARLRGVAAVVGLDAAPAHDAWCHVMSQPLRLGVFSALPDSVPYLAADRAAVAAWRARLGEGRHAGLVWAGNASYAQDSLRSVKPELLAPLGAVAGVRYVSLQKEALAAPDFELLDFTAELTSLDETAALIAALDLVIGVDTGVIHLAGALGVPVFLLNRADADWRWGRAEGASAWYPSLREFRQTVPRDWRAPVARVCAALAAL